MPRFATPAMTFALLAGLAGFALAAFSPGLLNDGDTYWHIRAGEWMIAHGAVLRADPFSYTAAGQPWQTQEWLAEILMALGWRAGWPGIHLLFATASGATAGLVGYALRRRMDLVPALLATVLGLSCVAGSLLARPHVLSLPLLALWTAGLVTARENNRAPHWWLIAVMPLWANLHGSFAFGLALAGALALEAVIESPDRKRAILQWGLFGAAATASAMLTPFGVQTLLFPLHLTGMSAIAHIGEWQAADFSQFTPFTLVLLATLFVLGMGKMRVPHLRLLLLAGLTWLALSHARHQMLLGIVGPLLLAPSLAAAWPARDDSGRPLWSALAALAFAALIALRLILPVTRSDDPVTPMTALEHVPRFVREMPVLNDYAYGGWLIWNGVKPFIDSRADLYGDIFVRNYADIVAPDRAALESSLAYYHVRWTIFPAASPVVRMLDATPGWHRHYSDKLAVVHVRE